jgi:hypothetical protein
VQAAPGRPTGVLVDQTEVSELPGFRDTLTWSTIWWPGRPDNKNLIFLVSAVHVSGRLGLGLVDQEAWKMPSNEVLMHF